MPAPKVHRESREIIFFALVAKKFFCASRPVSALKVHRESKENFVFALRAPCPRLRFIGQARIFFFFALRAPCPRLGFIVKVFFFLALHALCPRLRFTRKSKETTYTRAFFFLFARACAYA